MFCTQCGVALEAQDRFCRQCGHATGVGAPSPSGRRLTRDMEHKKIAGVCAGFANYLEVDVVLVRILWLVLAFGTGLGFIAYIVAWIVMPKQARANPMPAAEYVPQHS